jgi:hypothetical protein
MFIEMDEIFKRVESKIVSKREQVHQVYESNCIAIEEQFKRQRITENLAKRADDMAILIRENLAMKMSQINERMSLYNMSPRWKEIYPARDPETVRKRVFFGILNMYLGYEKSTHVLANNCNQFFLSIFEREANQHCPLPYINNLKFFNFNYNNKILRLHGFYHYEIDEIFSLNNNQFVVFLYDISQPKEMLCIVVDAQSQITATQSLVFDCSYCNYKVVTPTHVDIIVIHYWWQHESYTYVLDYNLNFIAKTKKFREFPFENMLINNNLIVLKFLNQFIFFDFFLNLCGNHTIDKSYKSYQICQFNNDFVYLRRGVEIKRNIFSPVQDDLTTIRFLIYDYKINCCYKEIFMNFHNSAIPRSFALQFDIFSNIYVYNYAGRLRVYDKYGFLIESVESQDISNCKTLDELYLERCNLTDWEMPLESRNFKMIYIVNCNNIFG